MLETKSGKILLGIANEDVEGALAYTVAEARRRRVGVHVLHVVPTLSVGKASTAMVIEGETLRASGGRALVEVARLLEEQLDDLPVSTELCHGHVVPALVEQGRHAGLVVLQRRGMGHPRHIPTLSITSAVAARSSVAVCAVPGDWRPDPQRDRLVVAGIEDVEVSAAVVRIALEAARARAGRVRLLHAWHYSAFDDVVFEGDAGRVHEEQLRCDLRAQLDPLLDEFPEVPTELVVAHARAADAVVSEGQSAGLVVMGRHRSTVPYVQHLGSVVRAVLRESTAPVVVVDPALVSADA